MPANKRASAPARAGALAACQKLKTIDRRVRLVCKAKSAMLNASEGADAWWPTRKVERTVSPDASTAIVLLPARATWRRPSSVLRSIGRVAVNRWSSPS